MNPRLPVARLLAAALALALVLGPVAVDTPSSTAAGAKAARPHHKRHHRRHHRRRRHKVTPVTLGGQPLVGTFALTPGSDAPSTGPRGSYFRMIFPGGSLKAGLFFSNPSSAAADQSYTLLSPGSDGGLQTGVYQEPPSPAFNARGDALDARIITPTGFAGVNFSLSTAATDGQTRSAVPPPAISDDAGRLSGRLEAFDAEWNKLYFNQGSPKPDGTTPGITSPVTGTYDEATHAFVLEWASSIVGGPFNRFTGFWHLEGVFRPR